MEILTVECPISASQDTGFPTPLNYIFRNIYFWQPLVSILLHIFVPPFVAGYTRFLPSLVSDQYYLQVCIIRGSL